MGAVPGIVPRRRALPAFRFPPGRVACRRNQGGTGQNIYCVKRCADAAAEVRQGLSGTSSLGYAYVLRAGTARGPVVLSGWQLQPKGAAVVWFGGQADFPAHSFGGLFNN